MVNDFLIDRVNMAHALLDEMQVEQALWIIKNIKLRIQDKNLLGEIQDKENHIEIEYTNKMKSITGEPTIVAGKLGELNLWRIKEYIEFYDGITKSHDIL
jgi:hypothetical protein